MIYALTEIVNGNGFLAIYLAGVVIGNSHLRAAHYIFSIHNSMAWLSQISMFLMLGLLVTPSELLPHMKQALTIAFILIFIARPLAAYVSLIIFKFDWRQKLFISWVGLRGAVPIILALYPHLSGLADAKVYFNVAFFVVLISLTLQGWTVIPLARKLKLVRIRSKSLIKRTNLPDSTFELLIYEVLPEAKIIQQVPQQLQLPPGAHLASVIRDKQILELATVKQFIPGDTIYIICPPAQSAYLDDLFTVEQ